MSDGGAIPSEMLKFGRPRYSLRPMKTAGGSNDVPTLIRNLVRAGLQTPLPRGIKGFHPFLVDGLERELIEEVMRQFGGTQIKAAERLGINRNTLHKKLEQFRNGDAEPEEAVEPSEPAA